MWNTYRPSEGSYSSSEPNFNICKRAEAEEARIRAGAPDESGERIPEQRLELMPEAINTLREQQISESEAR